VTATPSAMDDAHDRGDAGEAELAVADILAEEQPGARLEVRDEATLQGKCFFFGSRQRPRLK